MMLERAAEELRRPLRVNAALFDARVMDEVLRSSARVPRRCRLALAPASIQRFSARCARRCVHSRRGCRRARCSPCCGTAIGVRRSAWLLAPQPARRSCDSGSSHRMRRASRSWATSTTGIQRRRRCARPPREACGRWKCRYSRGAIVYAFVVDGNDLAAGPRCAAGHRRGFRRAELGAHRRPIRERE